MASTFELEVHTPHRLFFSGVAQAIILTLADGEMCVYPGHSHVAAPVIEGVLRIKMADGSWKNAFVSCGVFEVKVRKNVIVVDAAEWQEEIDKERALASKKQAEEELASSNFKFETDKAKARLRRAEFRLKVLSMS